MPNSSEFMPGRSSAERRGRRPGTVERRHTIQGSVACLPESNGHLDLGVVIHVASHVLVLRVLHLRARRVGGWDLSAFEPITGTHVAE